jgi:DNA-binding NtrC family response regulator
MKPLSVLIADDEESIATLVRRCMEGEGHRAVCVSSAKQASAELMKAPFDLVITDVLMPDGDGLDLISGLRKAQPTARILAISGGGRYMEGDDCLRMARGLGAHAVIMKPFNCEQLLEAVQRATANPTGTNFS